MNKRSTLVTFASAAVLLGLFNINNSQTVKADTVEQPATDQRNTQTTTANNQNSKYRPFFKTSVNRIFGHRKNVKIKIFQLFKK